MSFLFFSNTCLAGLAGADPIKAGACDDEVVCIEIFEPVCGTTNDQELVTYPNACFAEAAGGEITNEGYSFQSCDANYLPVCG